MKTIPSTPAVAPKLTPAEILALRELLDDHRNNPNLRRKDLLARYGICQVTLDRWISSGRLPAAIRLAGPLWRLADLEACEAAATLDVSCPVVSGPKV